MITPYLKFFILVNMYFCVALTGSYLGREQFLWAGCCLLLVGANWYTYSQVKRLL